MRRPVLILAVAMCGAAAVAQTPDAAKVCLAQIRNQTATKFELPKLGKTFLANLQSTKLAKDGSVTLVPIEANNSDDGKAEVEKAGCEFAIYTRILRKPKDDTRTLETGTTYEVSKHEDIPVEIYGLQCTVERTSSGMPILIDRQFDSRPTAGDRGVLKLLAAEASRIEEALGKKIKK